VEYIVSQGETFETIGARLGVDPTAIARRNTRWVHAPLIAGMKLTVDAHRTVPAGLDAGILVNVPQKLLFVFGDDRSVIAVPVAVGRRDWPTPTGAFRVTRKEINPTWDVPWIRLSLPNMGLHGTNAPSSIPGFTTHGCVRVGSDAIRSLFDRVTVGTAGEIIYEPALLTKHDGRFFVEVHPDAYGRRPDALLTLEAAADYLGVRDRLDWHRVQDVVRLREGLPIDVTLK
jgi:L,D-transpeptidase ErfK/SrfK